MGKSPGKWIKNVLFGRKASRSNSSRRAVPKAANEKEVSATSRAPAADLTVDPVLTSHPAHGIAVRNTEHSEGVPSNLPRDGVTILSGNQVADDKGISLSNESNDADRMKREQAATKTQAAFRGYLARRAFRALKGIIRLQALVRGHLVRRQAIATLRCMQGIVKVQALVRGRIVRHSDTGLELYKKCSFTKALDAKYFEPIGENASAQTKKLFANAFVCKVLESSTISMPLRLQYGPGDPNSAWNWLESWTSSFFWRPLSQPKKIVNSKSQTRQGNFQNVEAEPGRPKRSVRRVFTANVDNGSTHSTSESEKPKRALRKASSHPVDSVQEHPQSELEKVKRNLRKVSSSTAEASERVEVETEKPKRILKKISSSPAPDISNHGMGDSVEKNTTMALPKPPEVVVSKQREVVEVETERPKRIPKKISSSPVPDICDHATSDTVEKNTEVVVSKQPEVETITEPLAVEGLADVLENDNSGVELLPFENSGNEENIPAINGDLISKDENQKSGRRRASFAGKAEYPENGVQNSPTLPSYMAATESAKAKLRAQGSPRFGQEGVEKNGITRRLSLPSSTNGKVNSLSPRTQRPTQASGKAGIRIDKSLLSSRDANEKVIQAEWRR